MDSIIKLIKKNTIRQKVTVFTLILLISLMTGYVSFFLITLDFSKNFNEMFNQSIELKSLSSTIETFEMHLESYLNTKDSDSFIAYLDQYNVLNEKNEEFNIGLSHNKTELMVNNISNILDTYLIKSQEAIEFKRGRNTSKYIESFNNAKVLSGYINESIDEINSLEFSDNLQDYVLMSERISELKVVFMMMTIAIVMLSIVFIYDFTQKISVPIEVLSIHASEISKGNYDFELDTDGYYKEAEFLATTFSEMAISIKKYISDLKGNVETENKLRLTETENLKIQNLLKQAELTALQSQINPHFLFNTLNAGVQLANLEDAEKTGEFLYNLSSMFRYNIQSLENTVTLKDELRNVNNYYELMKVRFDDHLFITFEVDDSVNDILMPPLILQPIIENSLIHGFEDKEEAGIVEVSVKKTENGASISIKDNGKGIEENHLKRLVESEFDLEEDEERTGHTTGLGLGNVNQRLKHFYGASSVLLMKSELGKYTEIIVNLTKSWGVLCIEY